MLYGSGAAISLNDNYEGALASAGEGDNENSLAEDGKKVQK